MASAKMTISVELQKAFNYSRILVQQPPGSTGVPPASGQGGHSALIAIQTFLKKPIFVSFDNQYIIVIALSGFVLRLKEGSRHANSFIICLPVELA